MSLTSEPKVARPNISVYWVPGCSSCIKAKEFVASLGEPFESLNILEHPDALAEVGAAGIRGAPAVRKGDRIVYAQSLDDLAAFFGMTRAEQRLPRDVLVARWNALQDKAREDGTAQSDQSGRAIHASISSRKDRRAGGGRSRRRVGDGVATIHRRAIPASHVCSA